MYVLRKPADIAKLSPAEKAVHFSFRPSDKDFMRLLNACPRLELIQMPSFSRDRLSEFIEQFMKARKIEIKTGYVDQGRPKGSISCLKV